MSKYSNWQLDKKYLVNELSELYEKFGEVKIYTSLDHVSSSGMTRYISAFYLDLDRNGKPFMRCIAREKKMAGCGMDMGFHLAYNLFMEAFWNNPEVRYQDCLKHCWI